MTFLTLALVVLLQSVPIPGLWQKVDRLAAGTSVRIGLKSGAMVEGSFNSSSTDAVILTNQAGVEVTLPKTDIDSVMKPGGRDGLRNGVLIGTATGFASGFLALMALDRSLTASGYRFDAEGAAIYSYAGLVGAGIGAVSGALIDLAIKGDEVLFRARR